MDWFNFLKPAVQIYLLIIYILSESHAKKMFLHKNLEPSFTFWTPTGVQQLGSLTLQWDQAITDYLKEVGE